MEKTIDIHHYVSNLDKNVYTIYNLPEEVIAVIFAYVSRSSKSFRDNLAMLIEDDELGISSQEEKMATSFSQKASKFHEKWVVGYGHSSVAEHAVAHIGIEKISRLASAELEIANSFNSFTEYSQRYQKPKRGDFYIPLELDTNLKLKEEFVTLNEQAYTVYESLFNSLYDYLSNTMEQKEEETNRAFHLRVEKIAFEDARYVLTMATYTNLGMTGNGRALRDTLVTLLSSPFSECTELANSMRIEIEKIIPTLLKYLKPSEYAVETRRNLKDHFTAHVTPKPRKGPSASLISTPDYIASLKMLSLQILIAQHSLSFQDAKKAIENLSITELENRAEEAVQHLRFFDNPLNEFQHITYTMEFCISEANWHQLLRHNRRTHFSYGNPTTQLGFTIPPNIIHAGLKDTYCSFIKQAEEVHAKLLSWNEHVSHYAVTNAHHRQITATMSLWELYHLINLRTSPEAQWDIRETFTQIYKELLKKQPALIQKAKRRL